MKRNKLSRGRSKKIFRKGAKRVAGLNGYRPMRGGIRI